MPFRGLETVMFKNPATFCSWNWELEQESFPYILPQNQLITMVISLKGASRSEAPGTVKSLLGDYVINGVRL